MAGEKLVTASADYTKAMNERDTSQPANVIVNLTDLKQQPRRAEPQLYPKSAKEMPPGKCGSGKLESEGHGERVSE